MPNRPNLEFAAGFEDAAYRPDPHRAMKALWVIRRLQNR
jgi:hypothetical protein